MAPQPEAPRMVRYQFQIDDETWSAWKETVPRSKSLEQRIIELIEADRDGRVGPVDDRDDVPAGDAGTDVVVPETVPARIDTAAARDAIGAALELIDSNGGVERQGIADAIGETHALGYDTLGRKGSWWRKVIKPGLEANGASYVNGEGWSR